MKLLAKLQAKMMQVWWRRVSNENPYFAATINNCLKEKG